MKGLFFALCFVATIGGVASALPDEAVLSLQSIGGPIAEPDTCQPGNVSTQAISCSLTIGSTIQPSLGFGFHPGCVVCQNCGQMDFRPWFDYSWAWRGGRGWYGYDFCHSCGSRLVPCGIPFSDFGCWCDPDSLNPLDGLNDPDDLSGVEHGPGACDPIGPDSELMPPPCSDPVDSMADCQPEPTPTPGLPGDTAVVDPCPPGTNDPTCPTEPVLTWACGIGIWDMSTPSFDVGRYIRSTSGSGWFDTMASVQDGPQSHLGLLFADAICVGIEIGPISIEYCWDV